MSSFFKSVKSARVIEGNMLENHNCHFRFDITLRVLNEVVPEKFEYGTLLF